jgi:molybdopterin molybdotransferase
MSGSGAEPMPDLQQALALATNLAAGRPVGTERIDLLNAFHRVLAEDIASDIDMPPFRQSTRDGFACRRADLGNDLEVVETVAAGAVPRRPLGPNQCTKVMTGAAVPAGADCVVMLEHIEHLGDASIRCPLSSPEDYVCPQGAHAAAKETVLRTGEMIEAPHIAVLASVGCTRPLVSRQPTVGVIATGSELVEPDCKPGPCQIRNSNSFQLSAMVIAASAVPRNYGFVVDDKGAIRTALQKAMEENDVVVLSGGVSRGDYDLVRDILEENHVELLFDKVGPAPGRPVVFGVSGSSFCFGLSGNPVSNFVMFELVVKPFLYALAGHQFKPATSRGELVGTIQRRKADKDLWLPVTVAENGQVHPVEGRRSMGIIAMCRANGLIHVPVGVSGLADGTIVAVRRI